MNTAGYEEQAGGSLQTGMLAMHLVAVHIKAVGPLYTLKDDGLSANRLEGTDW